jgi:hypothetical protein
MGDERLHLERLKNKECLAQVPVCVCGDLASGSGREVKPLLLCDVRHHHVHLRSAGQLGTQPGRTGVKRTSSSSGAATRTSKHRDLIGGMSRLVELAHRISRMFGVYFSIVRRSAACASRVRESASLMITTGTTRSVLWR